jgi:DNA-directed RNA polymerase III subunit RPC2
MVKTKTIEISKFDELPAGQNAQVAIMSYSGYDIEDAVILNKSSLDRGFGRALCYRRWVTSMKTYPDGTTDVLSGKPPAPSPTDPKAGMFKKYRALDRDGLSHVGHPLVDGDIYINKSVPETPVTADG